MTHLNQCSTSDGNERCCLVKAHEGVHMGRWYTMKDEDIAAWEAWKREHPEVRL